MRTALFDVLRRVDDNLPDWFEFMYGYVRAETQLGCFAEAEEGCQKMLRKVTPEGGKATRFRSTIELLGNVYYRSAQLEKLSQLNSKYTWIDMKNIERPPFFL